jgi:hypothetical protein
MRYLKKFNESISIDEFSSLFLDLELDHDLDIKIDHCLIIPLGPRTVTKRAEGSSPLPIWVPHYDEFQRSEFFRVIFNFNSPPSRDFGEILHDYVKRSIEVIDGLEFKLVRGYFKDGFDRQYGRPRLNTWDGINDIKYLFNEYENLLKGFEIIFNFK